MAFTPMVPSKGVVGWNFLKSTYARQKEIFLKSPEVSRDLERASASMTSVGSVDALLADRTNLKIVLGAFGLEKDIDNRYFIKKIIESDSADPKSLANRMSDQRYKDLANSMAELHATGSISLASTRRLIAEYETKSFEVAVGDQSNEMRLALNAEREMVTLAQSDASENTKWYKILGTPPLRTVIQTYLRLPSSIAKLDLDTQKEMFANKLQSRLGIESLSNLSDPGVMKKLVQGYLMQSQINTSSDVSGSMTALTLLKSSQNAPF
ncbi:DUF1217 domain-containing protein [Rhodobacteraceae bacterium]|nr:DUF1217 domain-containing protein [Paracoccaceae bacterium]